MPCYQIQQCSVELNSANDGLLKKALLKIGYRVTTDLKGKITSFVRGKVSGTYDGKALKLSAPTGVKIDSNEIKRAYSEQVIREKAEQARAQGWEVEREGDEWTFHKPQNNKQAKVFA